MPPKKKPEPAKGKKGAVGPSDYSDIATLPHIRNYVVSLQLSFHTNEHK